MKSLPILKQFKNIQLDKIDYSFQKQISYSQISTFNTCPKKWELQYKLGNYISSPSIHLIFGTSIHHAIQKYISTMYEESATSADRIDLEECFGEKFKYEYLEAYKKNKNQHFSNAEEMREFYNQGHEILNFLKKKRRTYFSKRNERLVGIELPLLITPNHQYNNIKFKGFLDVVLYHEATKKFKIIDIKTSGQGWNAKDKKDENKLLQILLYKHFFSQQFHIPIEDIEIEFFIVKRKLWEESPYPLKRVQLFVPVSGKTKINKAITTVNDFISTVFETDGKYKEKEYKVNPSLWNCRFCAFNGTLCKQGIK